MIKIRNLILTEAAPISRLSDRAASLLSYMYDLSSQHFDLEDLRMWNDYKGWRELLDLLYELESRSFGKVIKNKNVIKFRLSK